MRTVATLTATAIVMTFGVPSAQAFDDTLRAHGGFWNWRAYRTMRYDLAGWPFSRDARRSDLNVVDLQTKRVRVDSGAGAVPFHVAFDGRDAWVRPSPAALNSPPRFYALAPYTFIGMPFTLAEAGVTQEDLGYRNLGGRRYEAYRFVRETGPCAVADEFIAYVDDDTRLLQLVVFRVTDPLLGGTARGTLARHAVVFDEWQTVDGLTVPRRLSIHEWVDGRLGERKAELTVSNADFDRAAVSPAAFARPAF
jgi:hypothetical protein